MNEVLKPPIFIIISVCGKSLKEIFGIFDTLNRKSVSDAILYEAL